MVEYSNYFKTQLPALLTATVCTEGIVASCLADSIISDEEHATILDITQKFKRNTEFWGIIVTRKNCLDKLIRIFEEKNQNTVVEILKNAVKNDAQRRVTETNHAQEHDAILETCGAVNRQGSHFRLTFKDTDDMQLVLTKLLPSFTRVMCNRNTNLQIILQLTALNYYDRPDVQEIISGNYGTELQRMVSLFDVIRITGREGIIACLEKLCNLDDHPTASRTHREIIKREFDYTLP